VDLIDTITAQPKFKLIPEIMLKPITLHVYRNTRQSLLDIEATKFWRAVKRAKAARHTESKEKNQ
jgi:hypothetical protein